jgi:electron-transferring-flavoprotein dehydrogenase
MERVDVAVVGGGPAGAAAGYAAAAHGATATVFEKGVPRTDREGLGPDSTDAAGILDYWVDIMGIHPDEFPDGVVLRELNRAEFRGPTESCTLYATGIDSSYDYFGYTMHRARFDDFLRSRAEGAGATYRVGVPVRDVETTPGAGPRARPDRVGDVDGVASDGAGTRTAAPARHVVRTADGEDVAADYLILADGPQRTITNRVLDRLLPFDVTDRLSSRRVNHIAYQEYREFPPTVFEEVRDAIVFWWGHMPGHTAYPWVFPNEGTVCRVGLTMPIGMEIDDVDDRADYPLLRPDDDRIPRGGEYVRRLLESEYGDDYDVETDFPLVTDHGKSGGTETYPISSTRPIDSPTEAGIAVAGGAMGTTSAFHEGGDHVAVRTGHLAGKLAAHGQLWRYNRAWKDAIGDELLRNVTMADMARSYGPDEWDRVFRTGRRMLADEHGYRMFDRGYGAGLDAAKLLANYQFRKLRRRNGRYVQLTEDEYVV